MNAQAEKTLLEKLKTLPPTRLAEVEDFVDFLKAREERSRDEAALRLGDAFAKLDALNAPPLASEEVQAEIDAARAERRAGSSILPASALSRSAPALRCLPNSPR